jgi:hypothetical protein
MSEKPVIKVAPVVKVLRIVLVTLLALYGMGLATFFYAVVRVFPSLINSAYGLPFWGTVKFFFDWFLPGAIYFFVGYNIFRLISLVSRGEPFSVRSPRYIRRIGYAVLCLAGVNALIDITSVFAEITTLVLAFSKPVVSAVCSVLSTLLLGFGFLVIAKVIEVGVTLKQDQDLTV